MILGFKQHFPDKTPTYFVEKILQPVNVALVLDVPKYYPIDIEYKLPTKLHSIRKGNRWRADMPIQMAYGVRTKKYWQFNKGIQQLSKCISVQRIFITYGNEITVSVDGKRLSLREVLKLIKNDGITEDQFINWFFQKGTVEFSGQIIHWTNLRY